MFCHGWVPLLSFAKRDETLGLWVNWKTIISKLSWKTQRKSVIWGRAGLALLPWPWRNDLMESSPPFLWKSHICQNNSIVEIAIGDIWNFWHLPPSLSSLGSALCRLKAVTTERLMEPHFQLLPPLVLTDSEGLMATKRKSKSSALQLQQFRTLSRSTGRNLVLEKNMKNGKIKDFSC